MANSEKNTIRQPAPRLEPTEMGLRSLIGFGDLHHRARDGRFKNQLAIHESLNIARKAVVTRPRLLAEHVHSTTGRDRAIREFAVFDPAEADKPFPFYQGGFDVK